MKNYLEYDEVCYIIENYLSNQGWSSIDKIIITGSRKTANNPEGLGGSIEVTGSMKRQGMAAPPTQYNSSLAQADELMNELDEFADDSQEPNKQEEVQLELNLSDEVSEEDDCPFDADPEPEVLLTQVDSTKKFKNLFGNG